MSHFLKIFILRIRNKMSEIIKTMKLCIKVSDQDIPKLQEITELYRQACNEVSDYIFNQ